MSNKKTEDKVSAQSSLRDLPEVQAALKRMRPKLYARARAYWQKVGDVERLKLTDEELDEQFWLFDQDGIPRRNSDQGNVEIAPDPLVRMAETARRLGFQSGHSDISSRSREILDTEFPEYLTRRQQDDGEQDTG